MTGWIKWLLVLIQGGGGTWGLVALARLGEADAAAMGGRGWILGFGLFYLLCVVAALLPFRNPDLGTALSLFCQALCMPVILTTRFVHAPAALPGLKLTLSGKHVGLAPYFGTMFRFVPGDEAAWVAGLNLVAVAMFALLVREARRLAGAYDEAAYLEP